MRLLRHVWALGILAAGIFAGMTLLEFLYFRRLSGGLASLDTRLFGFGADDGMRWVMALGPTGREAVIVWHYMTFDLVFPLVFGALLAGLVLAAGMRNHRFAASPTVARVGVATMLAAPYAVLDYAQNLVVARMLSNPLNADPPSLALASSLGVAKFAFAAIPLIVACAFLLAPPGGTRRQALRVSASARKSRSCASQRRVRSRP